MIGLEAVGVPGAGKSTVVHRVFCELRDAGVDAWNRARHQEVVARLHSSRPRVLRAAALASFAAERPALLAAIGRLTASTRPPLAVSWARAWNLWRMAHNEVLLEHGSPLPELVLHDQSLLQEIWSVLYLRPCADEGAMRTVMEELGEWLPQVIFLPLVDGRLALERMASRRERVGFSTDLDRMPELRAEDLERAQREARRIAEMASDVTGAPLVVTDGSLDPSQQAEQVLSVVEQVAGNRRDGATRKRMMT